MPKPDTPFLTRADSPHELESACADLNGAARAALAHAAAHPDDGWSDGASPGAVAPELTSLEARVRALVAAARGAGAPPRRVLAILRSCIREAPGALSHPQAREAIWARSLMCALAEYCFAF